MASDPSRVSIEDKAIAEWKRRSDLDSHVPKEGVIVMNRVFVKGIPKNAMYEDVQGAFEIFGTITDVNIVLDEHGYSKGFGFVTFDQASSALSTLESEFSIKVNGIDVTVAPAIKKQSDIRHGIHNASIDSTGGVSLNVEKSSNRYLDMDSSLARNSPQTPYLAAYQQPSILPTSIPSVPSSLLQPSPFYQPPFFQYPFILNAFQPFYYGPANFGYYQLNNNNDHLTSTLFNNPNNILFYYSDLMNRQSGQHF